LGFEFQSILAHEKKCQDAEVQGKFVTNSTPPDEIVDAVLALIDHDDIFKWEAADGRGYV
jgi:hypothetical protein